MMLRWLFLTLLAAPVVAALGQLSSSRADDVYPPPYDGLQAGRDAYSYAETRRRMDTRRQVQWLDESRVRQGVPPSYGTVIYDVPPVAGYSYDGLWTSPFGYRRYSQRVNAYGPGGPVYPIYGGGSLLGTPYYNPAPQPIGQVQVQTGPDRWESHPVYPPPPVSSDTVPLVAPDRELPLPAPRAIGPPREF